MNLFYSFAILQIFEVCWFAMLAFCNLCYNGWLHIPKEYKLIKFIIGLGNSMAIPNPILNFTSNDSLDHKSPNSCLWTDLNIFLSLNWTFDRDSKSDIVLYLKWLNWPQNFVIIIRCKINFDIIWYSVIFAANLYLSIFVWSSDILTFVFMNAVILV